MKINLEIEKFLGIKNKINFSLSEKNIIFAPNGTGKTCISKGFEKYESENKTKSKIILDRENIDVTNNFNIQNYYGKDFIVINESFLNLMIKKDLSNIIYEHIQKKYENQLLLDFEEWWKNNIKEMKNATGYNPAFLSNINSISFINDKDNEKIISNFKKDISNYQDIHKNNFKYIQYLKDTIWNFVKPIKNAYYKNPFGNITFEDYDIEEKKNFLKKISKFIYFFEEKNSNLISFIEQDSFEEPKNTKKINYAKYLNNVKNIESRTVFENLAKELRFDYLDKFSKELDLDAFTLYVQKERKEENIELTIKSIKNNQIKHLKKYEEILDKIIEETSKNKILKVKWTLQKIKNENDLKPQLIFKDYDNEITQKQMQDFSSSGQKRIVLLLFVLLYYGKEKNIILDDVFSSMDIDNIYIFIDYIYNNSDNWTILTHNFNLFLNVVKFYDNISCFIMDSFSDTSTFIFELENLEKKNIENVFYLAENNNLDYKDFFFSTILYEILTNYNLFLNEKSKTKILNELKYYRHYKKKKRTFQSIEKKILNICNDLQENNPNSCFINIIEKFYKTNYEYKISEWVINSEILESIKFKNFSDYIITKYFFCLKMRFILEEKERRIQLNNSEKEIKKYIDMILHLNNLRWDAVIESPLYKLKMYYNIISK
ncbi:hypothetical protein [Spiroplasma endosymbiont of Amphibalanus improvisus]|uniref:hypothetical protein n=1 Tax=Spiroplasma endosymbiont of Amphibalanus improvisus TaxID=3066327 RepID=UPI00313E1A81